MTDNNVKFRVFFDTETTGLPNWKEPSGSDVQPHMVQLGAILVNEDSREIVDQIFVNIAPNGWTIPEEVSTIHGITDSVASETGIPEDEATKLLNEFYDGHGRACFNRTFDQRIVRIAMKRYMDDEAIEQWAEKDSFECVMMMAKHIMKLPNPNGRGNKNPSLAEAYKYFIGKEVEGAHNALVDAIAAKDIYYAIKDRG